MTTQHTLFPSATLEQIVAILDRGISRQEAVALAVSHNKELQAKLIAIGIAQAYKMQAGFFTNPLVSTIFQFPVHAQTIQDSDFGYEMQALFSLDELWQVPLRMRVAHNEYTIKVFEVLQDILELIANTRKAYDTILYHQALRTMF